MFFFANMSALSPTPNHLHGTQSLYIACGSFGLQQVRILVRLFI